MSNNDDYIKMLCRIDDIEEVDPEDQGNDIDSVEIDADYADIISNIGTPDFKPIYMACSHNIRRGSIEKQKDFCKSIINKIYELWGFEFPHKIYADDQEEINEIYRFLEFVEYKCIRFLINLLEKLYFDYNDIKNGITYTELEPRWIEIQNIIKDMELEKCIFLFLLTNSKNNALRFLYEKINLFKSDIIAVMMYEKERTK